MFSPDLESAAFRSTNVEFGWRRDQVPRVVDELVAKEMAILGGEVWWVPEDGRGLVGLIPQRHGPDAVYHWETERHPGEEWDSFVQRCAVHTIEAVRDLPDPDEIPVDLPDRILYNLTWVAESEYGRAGEPHVVQESRPGMARRINPSGAEYGLVAWVYRPDAEGTFALDWALSRQMAAELAEAYVSPMPEGARQAGELRKKASQELGAFARGRCRPGPTDAP